MNLSQLTQELRLIIQDAGLEAYFKEWINEAILQIASDFDLPALKRNDPHLLSTNALSWLYEMPESYHKDVFRATDGNYNRVKIRREIDELNSVDADHDDTGDNVTEIAIQNQTLAIYPKANDTLRLWYYNLPEVLDNDTDKVLCIPPQFHSRVIIPKVLVNKFSLLMDLAVNPPVQSLAYWEAKYRAGLFGDRGGDIGMINFFNKAKGPRKHGGRNPLP